MSETQKPEALKLPLKYNSEDGDMRDAEGNTICEFGKVYDGHLKRRNRARALYIAESVNLREKQEGRVKELEAALEKVKEARRTTIDLEVFGRKVQNLIRDGLFDVLAREVLAKENQE